MPCSGNFRYADVDISHFFRRVGKVGLGVCVPHLRAPYAFETALSHIRIAGEPLFDSPFTNAEGIDGMLGHLGSNARIGLAEYSPHAVYDEAFYRARVAWPHEGVVLITRGVRPGFALLNAEHYLCPSVRQSSKCEAWTAIN